MKPHPNKTLCFALFSSLMWKIFIRLKLWKKLIIQYFFYAVCSNQRSIFTNDRTLLLLLLLLLLQLLIKCLYCCIMCTFIYKNLGCPIYRILYPFCGFCLFDLIKLLKFQELLSCCWGSLVPNSVYFHEPGITMHRT